MVDTIRDQAAILALLANNTSKNISPQDSRDGFVSNQIQAGKLYVENNAVVTPIATDNTWTEANLTGAILGLTTTTIDAVADWGMPAAGRLEYLGTETRLAFVSISLGVIAASANKVWRFGVGKNGIFNVGSAIPRKITGGGDEGAIGLHDLIVLDQNDYVHIMVENTTDATDMTVQWATITALSILL